MTSPAPDQAIGASAAERVDEVRLAHLADLVNRCRAFAGVFVSAPAGYGKIDLARALTAGKPCTWVRVQHGATPDELFAAIARALASAYPDTGIVVPNTVDSSAQPLAEAFFQLADDVSIVLDSAHRCPSDTLDAVWGSAQAAQTSVRLVVLSQAGPTPTILRSVANGRAHHLDAASLAYTEKQCGQMTGSSSGGAKLHAATGGWPIAVHLQARNPASLAAPSSAATLLQLALDTEPSVQPRRLCLLARIDRLTPELIRWAGATLARGDLFFRSVDVHWTVREWAAPALLTLNPDDVHLADLRAVLEAAGLDEQLVDLELSLGNTERVMATIEARVATAVDNGHGHLALRLVDRVPFAERSIELRVDAAKAAMATADRRPTDHELLALVADAEASSSGALTRAKAVLANHFRMNGDHRVVEVCLDVVNPIIGQDPQQAVATAQEHWPHRRDRLAAADLLRFVGQVTMCAPGAGNIAKGRADVEAALAILGDAGSAKSQQAWLAYIEVLLHARSPESALFFVRATAMQLLREHHSDAPLRLSELAVLCYFAGRYDESASTIELANEAASLTGNTQATIPLDALALALETIRRPGEDGLVDDFEQSIAKLLDHGHLVTFHGVFAAEFGLLQLRSGRPDLARRFCEIAKHSPKTVLSDSFAFGTWRLTSLLAAEDRQPDAKHMLQDLLARATELDRPAMAEVIEADMVRYGFVAGPDTSPTPPATERPATEGNDGAAAADSVTITTFGPTLRVHRGGHELAPPVGNQARLLVLLIASSGAVALDVAVEYLWPDVDPAVGRNRLHGVLLRLRRSLGFGADGPIACRNDVVLLEAGPRIACDAWDLEQAVAAGKSGAPPSAFLDQQFRYDDHIDEYRTYLERLAARAGTNQTAT